MSVESAYDRLRKCVVTHTLTGFTTAREAAILGNTVEKLVCEKAGNHKFRKYLASPETTIDITEDWIGETALKTVFLAIPGQDIAQFICCQMKEVVEIHNKVHEASVKVATEVIKGKPQPQFIHTGLRARG